MKRITIYGNLKSSKNNKKIKYSFKKKRRVISKSDEANANFDELLLKLPKLKPKFKAILQGREKPYNLVFKIYRATLHRFDYVNMIQNLLDAMVKVGIIEDDDANNMIPHFQQYELDRENPRVEIWSIDKINYDEI